MTDTPTLASALAEFQLHLPTVSKGQTARIPGKDGKTGYSYDYADLTDVSAAILPALANVGLAWMTAVDTADNGNIILKWSLMHGMSGESVTGAVPVGRAGEQWQSLGSSITYARRYCLIAVTGVAPGGDDNDGADARAGAQPRQEPAAPVKEYLPEGLYDIAGLTTKEQAEQMFYAARGAGHLNLVIGLPGGGEAKFGDWLRLHGSTLPPAQPTPEEAEAAAIAAHEAELAQAETASAPRADDDAPVGDR